MRHYTADSPQAVARLLSLAILADGGLDVAELRVLGNYDLARRMDIDDALFDQVMREFCYDLMQFADTPADSHLVLDREMIAALLRDIRDPSLQMTLLRIMLDVVHADGSLAGGEAVLLSEAMINWGLDLHHLGTRHAGPRLRRPLSGRRLADRAAMR